MCIIVLFFYYSVLFLMLSAVALTYKILDLEAKLEARSLWTTASSQNFRYIYLYAIKLTAVPILDEYRWGPDDKGIQTFCCWRIKTLKQG